MIKTYRLSKDDGFAATLYRTIRYAEICDSYGAYSTNIEGDDSGISFTFIAPDEVGQFIVEDIERSEEFIKRVFIP